MIDLQTALKTAAEFWASLALIRPESDAIVIYWPDGLRVETRASRFGVLYYRLPAERTRPLAERERLTLELTAKLVSVGHK